MPAEVAATLSAFSYFHGANEIMAFFENEKTVENSIYSKCTKMLVSEIRTAKPFWRIRTTKSWPEGFRRIATKYGLKRFSVAFDFLIRNFAAPGMPHIFSPRGMMEKFPDLENCMTHNLLLLAPLAISPAIQKTIDETELAWPGNEGERLADCLQRSMDAYAAFRDRLLVAIETQPTSPAHSAAKWFYRALPDPDEYAEIWLLTIHNLAWNWKRWNGNIMSMVWRAEGKLFARYATNLLMEYDADPDSLKTILAFLAGRSDI
jgi:hypothetical protein